MLHSFHKDRSIRLLECPEDMVSAVPLGSVITHNLLKNERRNKNFSLHASEYYWQRRMMNGFSIRAIMAEIDQPKIKGSYVTTKGKVVLNGAAAHRARNKIRKSMNYSPESITIFDDMFPELKDPSSVNISMPSCDSVLIDAKNFYNFFHFTSESLHQAFSPSIYSNIFSKIFYVTKSNRIEPFIKQWVETCNSLLAQDLFLECAPNREEQPQKSIAMPLSCEHLLYQFSGSHHQMIEAAKPAGNLWTGYDAKPHPVKVFQQNSFSESLHIFKEMMINFSRKKVSKSWSKLIYAARSKSTLRKRIMEGEDLLIKNLLSIGFEVVYFENMSPLEQVKCVSEAECLIGQHGAGLANMIFANENAHIFEIATYQTAVSRWTDFIPLCHVAGCHYHLIVVGMNFHDENRDPSYIEDGFFAPVILDDDINNIVEIINSSLLDKKNGKISGVINHCDFFIERGAYAQAYRLLDINMRFFDKYSEYWEQRAKLAELCGHNKRAYDCFQKAHDISQSNLAWDGMARLEKSW